MFGFIYIVFILSHPIQHSKACIIKHIVHRWSDSMILIQTQISVPMSHKNRITVLPPNQVCFPRCISQIGALKQNCQACSYSIIIYLCISSPLYNYMKVHKHWDTFLSHCTSGLVRRSNIISSDDDDQEQQGECIFWS